MLAEGMQGRVQRRRTRCFVFRDALFTWLQRDETRNGWTQKKARNISRRVVLVGDAHVTVPIHANKHKILLAVKKGGVNHEVLLASARRSHRSDVWPVARFLQILMA